MQILETILEFLKSLVVANESAVLGLPTEVKTILFVTIIICLGSSIIRKASKFIEVMLFVTIAYVAATMLGFI